MIAELNLNEVLYVSGGATCPEGTRVESVTITENSDGTSSTVTRCVATSATETVSEGSSILSNVGSFLSDAADAIGSFFGG